MKGLNIFRIIVFAVALLLFHILDGLFIPSFAEYEAFSARAFWFIIGHLIQAVIVIAIFAKLAQIQTRLLYVHVACVFILCELLGFAVLLAPGENVLATPIIVMIFDYGLLCVLTIIGTEIGRRLQVVTKKESN